MGGEHASHGVTKSIRRPLPSVSHRIWILPEQRVQTPIVSFNGTVPVRSKRQSPCQETYQKVRTWRS